MVDEEVAIKIYFTGFVWILFVAQGFFCIETRFTKDVKPLQGRPPHPPLARSPERRVLLAKGATRACPSCSPLEKAKETDKSKLEI